MDHVEMAPGMRHHPASRTLKTALAILIHSKGSEATAWTRSRAGLSTPSALAPLWEAG